MPVFGKAPLSENNGTPLGVAYVRIDVDATGKVAGKSYWNHANGVFEAGPRDDSKHVLAFQRLSGDAADFDNMVQVAPLDRGAMEEMNVLTVVYNITTAGKVSGVYSSYGHDVAAGLGAINRGV